MGCARAQGLDYTVKSRTDKKDIKLLDNVTAYAEPYQVRGRGQDSLERVHARLTLARPKRTCSADGAPCRR